MDGGSSSSGSRARTCDPLINSQLLCQLSYPGMAMANDTGWTTADKRRRLPLSFRANGTSPRSAASALPPPSADATTPPGLRDRNRHSATHSVTQTSNQPGVQKTAMNALLGITFALTAFTSSTISRSFVTMMTGASSGRRATSARITSSAVTPSGEKTTRT